MGSKVKVNKPKKKKLDYDEMNTWQKAWYFVWYDDSLLSWLVNILLAFLIIKFFLYPVMGLVMGTNLPVVAVISESMEHPGGFEEWWDSPALCGPKTPCTQNEFYNLSGISKEEFKDFTLHKGFNKGDVIILRGVKPKNVEIGDVLVFYSSTNSDNMRAYPIIHRVVSIDEENLFFETKGDHNPYQINEVDLNETRVEASQILGKGVARIPWVGYVKLKAVDLMNFIIRPFTN